MESNISRKMTEDTTETLLQEVNNEKIREYTLAIVFSAVVVMFGVLGNSMSVLFYGFHVPRTSTNLIIMTLGMVDLFTSIVLSDEVIELSYTVAFKSVVGCKAMYFFNHWLASTSVLMLLVVGIDRYRKICKPLGWQFSIRGVKIAFGVCLTYACVESARDWVILDVVRVNVTYEYNKTVLGYYCTHSKDPGLAKVITSFHMLDGLNLFGVIIGLTVMYSLIARVLWKTRQRVKRNCGSKQSSTETSLATKDSTSATASTSVFYVSHDNTSTISNGDSGSGTKFPEKFVAAHGVKDQTRTTVKKEKELRIEKKITLMTAMISVCFVISFVPYFIINLAIKPNSNTSEQEFSVGIQIALRSYMLNNAINPYIIGYFNSKFRAFVKDFVLQKIFRCSCCKS